MQKVISKILVVITLIMVGGIASAQEQSLYTQYMFNGLSINPAYSGTDQAAVLTLSDREQWVGLDGAPSTSIVSFYTPVNKSNLSIGMLMTYDRLGVNRSYDGDLSAAYNIQLNQNVFLSMGLSIGIRHGIGKLNELIGTAPNPDPLFANVETNLYGNIGLGAMLYSDKFYVGISAPQLKGFLIREAESGLTDVQYMRHFYLTAGYLFNLSRNLDLKPNVLVRYSYNSPVVDTNVNLLISQKLWVGASYRVGESVSAVFQYSITPEFQVGYSYDFGTSYNQKVSSGSHEIMLSYRFIKNRNRVLSPRWF